MSTVDRNGGDDKPRTGGEIMAHEIEQGLSELRRPFRGLAVSGLSAGLDVSLGVLLMATAYARLDGVLDPGLLHMLAGNLYAIGFIFVILGRTELFTEHTTLAVFPVLAGKAGIGALGRLWTIVWLTNLVGAAAFSALAVALAIPLGIATPESFGELGRKLVEPEWYLVFGSAVLAGWLMGLLSWLSAASRDTIGGIVVVWLIAAAIGVLGLHHCIVGTTEVLTALFAGAGVSWSDYVHFITWATLGNVVGGTVFVALLKFGHASQPGPETEGEGDT